MAAAEEVQATISLGSVSEEEKEEMTDDVENQIIQCPHCKTSITVDQLGEHVNAYPDIKKEAIERELELWGEAYDRAYLIQNVVFCPECGKISHFGDCTNSSKK